MEIKKSFAWFNSYNSSYTAGLITNKLLQILEEFNINNNILALIINNESNIIVYGSQLVIELDQKFNNMIFIHYQYAIHIVGINYVENKIKKLH